MASARNTPINAGFLQSCLLCKSIHPFFFRIRYGHYHTIRQTDNAFIFRGNRFLMHTQFVRTVRFFHICFRHSRFGAECRTEGESFGPGSATRRPFIGKATTPRREQHRNKGTSTSIDKTTVPQRALHAAMKLPSRSATSARRGTGHPCPCSALDTRGCSCRTRAHACRAASAQAAKRPPPPVPLRRARRCRPATSCYNQFMR